MNLLLASLALCIGCAPARMPYLSELPTRHSHALVPPAAHHTGFGELVVVEPPIHDCIIGSLNEQGDAFMSVYFLLPADGRWLEAMLLGEQSGVQRLWRTGRRAESVWAFAGGQNLVVLVPVSEEKPAAISQVEVYVFDGGVPATQMTFGTACGTFVRLDPRMKQW